VRQVNWDKGGVPAFIEKAFSVVTSSLLSVGMAGIAAKGATAVLKGLLENTLGLGKDLAIAKLGEVAKGDKVDFAEFYKRTSDLLAQASLDVEATWKVADVRTRILNATYPQREAPAAVAGTEAIRDNAHRLQFTSTVTSWANQVNTVKGGDAGALVLDVTFAPGGTFTVDKGELPMMGDAFEKLLAMTSVTGACKPFTALTLGEALNAPTGGMKVIVRDQS